MSSKDRVAKSRARKKLDNPQKWQEQLEKDKLRKRAMRAKEKEDLKGDKGRLLLKREKDRERQRLWRLKKKNLNVEVSGAVLGSYKSPRTLGKAVKKVKALLPKSPSKKHAVFRRLIHENLGPEVVKNIFKTKKSGSRQLSEECKRSVIDFFNNDEISRQAPGKRDVKSVKDPLTGKRGLIQIRHMVIGIREAYEQFKVAYPDMKISKSKFYCLRPKNILPLSEMPHTICVCVKHANFSFLIEPISKLHPAFPKTHTELLESVCCDKESVTCMTNECKNCVSKLDTLLSSDVDLNKRLKWKAWKTVNNRPKLVENTTTLKRMILTLNSQLASFKTHTYIKRVQSQYFENCKKSLTKNPKSAVMQVDFAENYSIIHQDEIQSAHWAHNQTTIFTCCIWHKDKVHSFAVISDDLKHGKNSVFAFMKAIIVKFKEIVPQVNKMIVFSDNCAGQFKSRYNVSIVCNADKDFGVTLEWNFFASGHGKGAVDGVGGSVKRTVWREVQGRQCFVSTPYDFYKAAKVKCKETIVLFVPETEVDSVATFLTKRWDSLIEIPRIQSMHHFRGYDEYNMLISQTSVDLMVKVSIVEESDEQEPSSDERETPSSSLTIDRYRYKDVYTDSSDESAEEEGEKEEEKEKDDDTVTPAPYSYENLKLGVYVVVSIPMGNKSLNFVAVIQGEVQPDREVEVMFMQSYGTSKSTYIPNESDVSYISCDQIIGILPTPKLTTKGNRILYEFTSDVAL